MAKICLENIPYIKHNKVSFDQACKALKTRPILFSWKFNKAQWDMLNDFTEHLTEDESKFCVTYEKWKNHPNYTESIDLKYNKAQYEEKKIIGHATVLADMYKDTQNNEYILQIKNTWGSDKSYYGIFYISYNIFKECNECFFKALSHNAYASYFYDVFFYEQDLSENLKKSYLNFEKTKINYEQYIKDIYNDKLEEKEKIAKYNGVYYTEKYDLSKK